MFHDDYEKMTKSDQTIFGLTVNNLLYECFILRKTYDGKRKMFISNPDYMFLERYYSVFEDYLSYMDMTLSKNDEDGVIFVTSVAERNHLRVDTITTLLVYALRSYYEGQIAKAPEETEVLMTYGALASFLQEIGLSNATKRLSASTIASSLRTLDSFNIITKANGTYGDPSYSFFILPSIRFLLSSEKVNALYAFLTHGTSDETANFVDASASVPTTDSENGSDAVAPASDAAEPTGTEGGNNA
jgi:hypothetical protein